MDNYEANLVYGIAWIVFGLTHSLLAAKTFKKMFAHILGGYYRLLYNIIAISQIIAIWILGLYLFGFDDTLKLPFHSPLPFYLITCIGSILLAFSIRQYDLGLFSGLTQIKLYEKNLTEASEEPLRITGLNSYIRHPLYLSLYLILWGQSYTNFGLSTALWGSIYLFIGTKFEERRLMFVYGSTYQKYKSKVPALIPWRGRLKSAL